jgi:hypothetical protein
MNDTNAFRIICPYCKSDITNGPGPCYFCESEDDDFFADEAAYMTSLDRNPEDPGREIYFCSECGGSDHPSGLSCPVCAENIDPNDHARAEIQRIQEANDPKFQAELDQFVAEYEMTFEPWEAL